MAPPPAMPIAVPLILLPRPHLITGGALCLVRRRSFFKDGIFKSCQMKPPKIAHVSWRAGRPRFEPSETLRRQGHKGHDLKSADGQWLTLDQAQAWSFAFVARLKADKAAKSGKVKPKPKPAAKIIVVQKRRSYTVSQLLAAFLSSHAVTSKRENTQRDYKQKVRVIESFDEAIWHMEADALSKKICLDLYDRLVADRGLVTANGTLTVLGVALEWGIARGHASLPANPAHKLKKTTAKPRVRAASIAEYLHLVKTADALDLPEVGDMITFGVWMGQRQADRLALHWSDIAEGRMEITQEKTGKRVSIPVPQHVKTRLDAIAARTKIDDHGGLVLRLTSTGGPMLNDFYRKLFQKVRKAAAKTMPSVATLVDQDMRDTCTSWLARAGCTHEQVFAITGHGRSGDAGILRHYVAADNQMADMAMEKLAEWFARELEKLK